MPRFCSNCGNENRDNSKFCSNCGNRFEEKITGKNLALGSLLDRRYEIQSLIKSGGMGSVYKAIDIRLKRDCAVKEMLSDHKTEEGQKYAIGRFEAEAYILAHLNHPNLPTVIDYFIENERYYLVMDFVEGHDLDEILKKEGNPGLKEERVIKYAIQTLEVLDFLHNQNPPIIYRDLKPSNVMIRKSDEKAIIVDFGIARVIQEESPSKKTAIGTPGYLSPEQWKGNPEQRSDLYSLGATMHQLLTGIQPRPFDFKPVTDIVDISPDLSSIVMKALSEDLKGRYENASKMKEALELLLTKPRLQFNQNQKGKCFSCKKVFPMTDLLFSGEEPYCLDCSRKPKNEYLEQAKTTGLMVERTETIYHPKDYSEMILIPAGPFTMGSNANADEKPIHEVFIESYYIDKHLITNEQFKRFLDETGYVVEGNWLKYCAHQKVNYPVVGVTWADAMAYAKWVGKTLPTEAEWEKAAKGIDNREYPWGNTWDLNKCNNRRMNVKELVEDMIIMLAGRGTVPTGSFPEGQSAYGVLDMEGNVSQWCFDWYSNNYYSISPGKNPQGAKSGSWKSIRGGSWWDEEPKFFRCCVRTGDHPKATKATIGFRCVYKPDSSGN